jgi:hypothetical protein
MVASIDPAVWEQPGMRAALAHRGIEPESRGFTQGMRYARREDGRELDDGRPNDPAVLA